MSPAEWRESKGLSLGDVAGQLGVEGRNPARTLQRWEDGTRQPPLEIVERMESISDGAVTVSSWTAVRAGRRDRRRVPS